MRSKRIGWVGTGIMGRSMCERLLQAGYSVSVYNRTREKAESLLKQGARWADSPMEVAQSSEIVFLMLGYPEDVRKVVFGELQSGQSKTSETRTPGIIEVLQPGSILIDMTTSRPELAVEIAEQSAQRGIISLDAPVTGGDVGAKAGTLSIMIGGDEAVAESLRPFWDAMGKTVVYHGKAGSGHHAKMTNQTLIAANMCGVCEALLYAWKAGLDLEKVLQSCSPGAGGSWALSNMGTRIVAGDFSPGFYVEHLIKDMGIILDEARRLGIAMPGVALVNQLYIGLDAQGHRRSGTQALIFALAQLSNVRWS
ncbi:MAG: NAD(P)-dependent oxidoreductase [Thermoguttaceae bacterium]